MQKIRSAQILCVGTELLLGDIVNTNAAFLSQRLAELGIDVYRHTVVGDNAGRLKSALRESFAEADAVILTGGLGPTYDDMTKETVADYFGLPLVRHAPSYDALLAYFAKSSCKMTESNLKQADMPRGAVVFPNHHGTAPGMAVEANGKTAILLPGPPSEMMPMFCESVVPYLSALSESTTRSRNVHLFGIGEAQAETVLRPLMERSTNPTIAPYAKEGEVRLRVTAKAHTEDECLSMCDAVIAQIRETEVGAYIYGIDVDSLEHAAILALEAANMMAATAESCTGGYVAKRITDVAGASAVFAGGVVAYQNSVKESLLSVSAQTLAAHGAVSEETAMEMARGVRRATGADVGVSTTGIAGPGGGTPEKPVGLVYVAVSSDGYENVLELHINTHGGKRDYIRHIAANHALYLLKTAAEKHGADKRS